jgi:uncharacterized protein YkwD
MSQRACSSVPSAGLDSMPASRRCRSASVFRCRSSSSGDGSDGSSSGERVTRAGYAWRAVGENIASGQKDADAVVAAWLASPGHCATLMGPYFAEMGVAFAYAPGANPGNYRAQEFAAPR